MLQAEIANIAFVVTMLDQLRTKAFEILSSPFILADTCKININCDPVSIRDPSSSTLLLLYSETAILQ